MRGCPACNKDGVDIDGWRHCADCGLEYFNPFKSPDYRWYKTCGFQNHDEPIPFFDPPRHRRFFDSLTNQIGKVLEVGCGNGQFLISAIDRDFDVEGIDFDSKSVLAATNCELPALWADWKYWRHSKDYGAVVAIEVLEHLDNPREFMERCKYWIKDGGYLYLTVPNRDRPLWWYRERMDRAPHHLTRWDTESLVQFVTGFGFVAVDIDNNHLPLAHLFNVMFPFFRAAEILHWLHMEKRRWAWRLLWPFEKLAYLMTLPWTYVIWCGCRDHENGRGVYIAALFKKR